MRVEIHFGVGIFQGRLFAIFLVKLSSKSKYAEKGKRKPTVNNGPSGSSFSIAAIKAQ